MFDYTRYDESQLEFVEIVPVDEIPSGERIFIEVDGKPIVVFNLAGVYYAIGDVCTHDDGPLGDGELEGEEIVCPRHGGRFDLRTGKVTSMPAVVDIPAYPVRISDGMVTIGIPRQSAKSGL